MPLGEEYSHSLVVKVKGSPLAEDVMPLLVTGYVDESRHVPGLFLLRFSDPHDLVLGKIGAQVGDEVAISVQSSGPGGPVPLMSGQITALEREVGADGAHTVIRGLDHSHKLLGGARVRAFVQQSAGDIVRSIAQDAGMQSQVESIGPVFEHLAQDGLNDWDFVRRLADSVGAVVLVDEKKLKFVKPTAAADAPTGTAGARRDAQVLEVGVNLVSLRATITATAQVPAVEVRSWDVATKKELVGTASATTVGAQVGATTPVKLAGVVTTTKQVESVANLGKQGAVDAHAKSLADRRAGGFAELDGVARGNPKLRAGTAVALRGAGTRFDGKYVLSSVRHDFDPELGYLTSFTVSNASERSTYGVASGGDGVADEGAGSRGVLTALVTSVKDPEHRGRVKVRFPVLSGDYESWWARTVQAGAGNGRGTTILPEVNDEVLVAFGHGDFNEPYILGGLYNGKDKPGEGWAKHVNANDGSVIRRAMTSRTGMVVEMVESQSDEKLTISTNKGAQRITLVQNAAKGIEIISQGPVQVTAKADVTVKADQNISVTTDSGTVAIKGNQVSIEATSKLALKGAQVSVEGTATLDAKGANVKISAQATAELAGNAMTTIRGGLVKIN